MSTSASVASDALGVAGQEQLQPTREHMRLCCGVVQLLCERTACTRAEAAQCLGESEDRITNWQMFLHESNVPLPTLADLNDFCLFSLDIAQRRAVMTRLSARQEERQKSLSPRNEYIQSDWRRVCAMMDVLREQFSYTVSQAADILHAHLPNYYAWLRKLSRGGGHGIAPEEAYLLLEKKLGSRRLMKLASDCPGVRRRMVSDRQAEEECEPYDRDDAEWQIFLAVEILLEVPGIDQTLACVSLNVSEATYERYREQFGQREQTAEDRQRAAVLIVDLFDGELPKTQEEIRQRLQESYGQKANCFTNVLDAIRSGDGDSFEGRASDDYAPTDAMPGSHEKLQVMLQRIRRGDPSGFHSRDRCAYLEVKRADFIRDAIAEGMKK
ncbi:MAG: hypothetical protein PHX93_04030 [Candidatus Peribacteraceae bacterium]|nr:hypothetical protein [Candidatus Peribacteraceae bacterium]